MNTHRLYYGSEVSSEGMATSPYRVKPFFDVWRGRIHGIADVKGSEP